MLFDTIRTILRSWTRQNIAKKNSVWSHELFGFQHLPSSIFAEFWFNFQVRFWMFADLIHLYDFRISSWECLLGDTSGWLEHILRKLQRPTKPLFDLGPTAHVLTRLRCVHVEKHYRLQNHWTFFKTDLKFKKPDIFWEKSFEFTLYLLGINMLIIEIELSFGSSRSIPSPLRSSSLCSGFVSFTGSQ